jgi:integrase
VDVGDQLLGTLAHLARERFGADSVPPDEPIFLTPGGSRIIVTNFLARVWRPALAKAGLRYRRPYCLRHTFATMMLQTQSIRYVSQQLGHSSPTMTLNVYGHALPSERREAPARFEAQLHAARVETVPSMTSESR